MDSTDPVRQTNLTANLPEAELQLLESRLRARSFRKHAILFSQGDETGHLYIIQRGWVRTFHTAPTGKEVTIGLWSQGDLIGAPDICSDIRLLSAEAVEATELWSLSREDMDDLVCRAPTFATNLMRVLSFKVRWVTAAVDRLATSAVTPRVAQTLVTLAQIHGQREGGDTVIQGLSHEDISRMVGASRPWVSKTLTEFEQEGLLTCSKRRIALHDIPALTKETRQQ